MHQFKVGDPVYIEYGANGQTRRHYGHVVDTWSDGRYVDIRFTGTDHSWPFRATDVYHAEADRPDGKGINHVSC
jgi:hypothetical protein